MLGWLCEGFKFCVRPRRPSLLFRACLAGGSQTMSDIWPHVVLTVSAVIEKLGRLPG
jgi:hypothetical protein